MFASNVKNKEFYLNYFMSAEKYIIIKSFENILKIMK
jgi:hypothetical protein